MKRKGKNEKTTYISVLLILTHAIKTDFWDIDAMADAIYGILNYPALPDVFKKLGKAEVDDLKWENSALHVKQVYDTAVEMSN